MLKPANEGIEQNSNRCEHSNQPENPEVSTVHLQCKVVTASKLFTLSGDVFSQMEMNIRIPTFMFTRIIGGSGLLHYIVFVSLLNVLFTHLPVYNMF